MIEFSRFAVTRGEPMHVLVPTDSGRRHWVARPEVPHRDVERAWPAYSRSPQGLDALRAGRHARCATRSHRHQAHIFVRSRQPWVALGDELPRFSSYHDAATTWPAASLARTPLARRCSPSRPGTHGRPRAAILNPGTDRSQRVVTDRLERQAISTGHGADACRSTRKKGIP